MRREEILVFLATDKLYLYSNRSKKEKIIDLDTSHFFRHGEISNVSECEKVITEKLLKMDNRTTYLKPNYIILYNDVCWSDIKFLYRSVMRGVEYNSLKFVPITRVAKKINQSENLVIFDKNYYILVNRGERCMDITNVSFEPIMIGEANSLHVHYSDLDIVWRKFKTYFTNSEMYDNMDVGDDE